MNQAIQIAPMDFEDAPSAAPVAAVPSPVAAAQPHPAWYLTPVAVIPVAAAAFIVGNVLMMIPWSVF